MNDRYLFRGKRKDNGEWVQGHYRSRTMEPNFDRVRHFISMDYPETYEIDETTLGQCTGLKDGNGRLIFEGDIVNTEIAPGFNQNVKVVWHEGSWCLHVPYWETNGYDYWLLGRNNANTKCVVVGNVHDDPELLTQGA